jgi:hypothetical protein
VCWTVHTRSTQLVPRSTVTLMRHYASEPDSVVPCKHCNVYSEPDAQAAVVPERSLLGLGGSACASCVFECVTVCADCVSLFVTWDSFECVCSVY